MVATTTPSRDETATSPLRASAEALSNRLPPLLVEAERVAATIVQGVHGRRRIGIGETFWQFRHAREGDAITSIDWRQSAKADRLYVRENEWEAAESVWLWCDRSVSMSYASSKAVPEKSHRASVLTLALTSLLVRGGERVGLFSHAGGQPRPMTGRLALDRVLETLLGPSRGRSDPPATPLPRHSQAVLISDFLLDPPELEAALRIHAGRGVAGHLVQILDPAEEDLPFSGRTEFRDLEAGGRIVFDRPQDLRQAYAENLAAHREALTTIARSVGWSFTTHRTDRPAEGAMLALYQRLAGSRATGRA